MHCPRIMAPNHHFMLNPLPLEPVSRTYQYRKIMKPMLERKRRARINKCLDELKDLMTGTLQADGENVSKLEKADILELTVRHLHRLREHNALFLRTNETLNMEKFWAGFQHCAVEVSQFLSKYDQNISGDLVKHMASYVQNVPAAATVAPVAHTSANHNNRINSSNATTATAYRKQSAHSDIHPHTQSHAQSQQTRNRPTYANEGKITSKSNISSARHQQHPYARPTETSTQMSISRCGVDVNADPCAGDEDANVWRPW